jgi:hypothetical protein
VGFATPIHGRELFNPVRTNFFRRWGKIATLRLSLPDPATCPSSLTEALICPSDAVRAFV